MKRIKKKINSPNPLFEQWLEEWKEEAAARDSPIQYSFGKALASLKKYPLPLESGRDCQILQHFGEKLCSMIDKKLSQYRTLNNLPSTSAQMVFHNNDFDEQKKKKTRAKKTSNNVPSTSEKRSFSSDDNDDGNKKQKKADDNYRPENGVERKKKSNNRSPRPYIPKVGSAPFAILTTLYNQMQNPDYPGFMYKKDLIRAAQESCDCPMKGTALEHYAGWSSMSTLIEKNYVTKKNNPAKYRLTDAGYALAMSLLEARPPDHRDCSSDDDSTFCNNFNNVRQSHNEITSAEVKSASSKPKSSQNKIKSIPSKSPAKSKSNSSITSEINYNFDISPIQSPVKVNSELTPKKSPLKSSESKLHKDNFNEFDYLAGSPVHLNLSPLTKMCKNDKKVDEVVIIDDDSDNDEVFKYDMKEKTETKKVNNFEKIIGKELYEEITKSPCSSEEDFNELCKENLEPVITVKKKDQHFIFTETVDLPSTSSNYNAKIYQNTAKEVFDEVQPKQSPIKEKIDETKKKQEKVPKNTITASQKRKVSADDTPYESFYLLPNNFDIILLVDTQETSGGKVKPKDDETKSELSKLKVLFEVRSLKVGDFAWIGRCRFTNRELILPYIIERKRIDDLGSSITDGRYREQKFRLGQSGIKNVIYMIENYGKNYYGPVPLTSLFQAGVNSLVQDNFTVKYTRDHKDSMHYLATMTTMLTKIYEGKELISCRKKDLESENLEFSSSSEKLMEFTEFNKAAVKTKNFKVREMFIRQLLQLKGVSVEKAIAISEFYPTPKLLAEAFKNGDEKLLAEITAGSTKRKIGPVISKSLYQMYTKLHLN